VKDMDWFTVQGLELFAEQALVLPDCLQEAFGRGVTVLMQDRNNAAAHAPLGIKAGQDRRHLAIAFALKLLQCQASEADAALALRGRLSAPRSGFDCCYEYDFGNEGIAMPMATGLAGVRVSAQCSLGPESDGRD
jgi:hypothetical protein